MDKVTLSPDQDGYSFKDGVEVLRTQLSSGAGRFTRGILNAAIPLNVQWTCDADEYDYLMNAYRTHVSEGHAPFPIDLIIDDVVFTEHQVRIMPGTFGLSRHQGLCYVVKATLEVEPEAKTPFEGTIPKLTLPPDKDGYTFTMEATAEHQVLDGGLGRAYRDQYGVTTKINVRWTTGLAGFLYLRNFYRQWVTKPDSFPMDLILDTADLEEYNVWIVPGSMGVDSISGHTFVVSCQIEVDTDEALAPPPDGGTLPWLFYPTEPWPDGPYADSVAPIHKYTYEYGPITGAPEPFEYSVGVTDEVDGSNGESVGTVVIPLFGDSGIPGEGQYTWEPANPESDIEISFSDSDPSGGAWSGGIQPPNLFVSLYLPSGSGSLIGWGGGVLTLYAGNNPDTGAGQQTIITFLSSGFVYPPVSVYYGPLA